MTLPADEATALSNSDVVRRRVVHFTSAHPPFDTRIFHKECVSLAEHGYDVTLFAPGATAEVRCGVRLRPVPAVAGRLQRVVFGSARLGKALLGAKADVYHFHDPELLPLGIVLRMFGRRVIYDVHEPVRDDVGSKPYLSPLVARVLARVVGMVEDLAVATASYVVAATPTIAAQFPSHKTAVVHNYPDLTEVQSAGTAKPYEDREIGGCYVGGINPDRCIDELYAAVGRLHAERPEFHLTMAGPVERVADPASMPGVSYVGVLNREDVASTMLAARFGVVLLGALPTYREGLPTKFFEYSAAGIPSIVSRSNYPLAALADEEDLCVAVDENDPSAITDAMRWILDNPTEALTMGAKAQAATESKYNWAAELPTLLEVYRRVLS
jgi:glycosyltransferase involved in cell wall biosynthesis